MTRDNRRKKAARAYQTAHDSDYTQARQATERAPRRGLSRRSTAAAMLAVPRRDVCRELLRIRNTPVREPFVGSLVETVLARIDSVPAQVDETEGGQLWNVVMKDQATTDPVDSADIHAVADFLVTLVNELDNQQMVSVATELGITQRQVNYFSQKVYENTIDESGRPRLVTLIISRKPGEAAEIAAKADQAAAMAREHLLDTSGRSWNSYDRKVMHHVILEELANVGDAYLSASEEPEVGKLSWRRLPDGSMRADLDVADIAPTVSVVIKAITEDAAPLWSLRPEFYTEFYRPGRQQRNQTYMCYVGMFDEDAAESDIESVQFEELHSSGPYGQLRAQETGSAILAEVVADI